MDAVRREGVGRFTGLPLWRWWGRKKGYLPLILPLASEVGFCLSKYLRWDTRFCRLFMLCRWSLLYNFYFRAVGMSNSLVAQSRHLKSISAPPRTVGSSITSFPSVTSRLHSLACCCFFSATLSIYLVSEEYPRWRFSEMLPGLLQLDKLSSAQILSKAINIVIL